MAADFKFSHIHLTGGLMPHTLIAVASADGAPLGRVLAKHFTLGTTFTAVGHGLDVLLATPGPSTDSLIKGFRAACYPKQAHLLQINGLSKGEGAEALVCSSRGPSGATVVISASYWGPNTVEPWFAAVGLGRSCAPASERFTARHTVETVFRLDVGRLPGMVGAAFGDQARPRVAVFVDEVVDPIEAYTIIWKLMEKNLPFVLLSHSLGEEESALASDPNAVRIVSTETVFGNAMYGLRECACLLPTLPANRVPPGGPLDSFFVAGGQCPYQLLEDPAGTAIMDGATVAAAVCHGPEALIGSKWLAQGLKFTAYTGCWMSFRHVLGHFQKKSPGETCQDGLLFSGNAPNATLAMAEQACTAILAMRAQQA